ncbi:Lrp/AsnC ligand binding domain-containing protein [Paracoccaceae bacterium Fryx2]|nr:Lrp/AsnC ligand binding domain-containing protein [Paracoccaceae bacterium Fryx2]
MAGGSADFRGFGVTNDLVALDRFDHAILRGLAADGRISATELARRVGLSKSPVQARIKRLEAAGVITGYRAVLDPIKMGQSHVAFVEVRLSDTREAALQAFNKAVLALPEVEQCHMIASRFDYLLKVRSSDIQDYRRILGEKLSALPHVASTSTYVAMEAVKDGPV